MSLATNFWQSNVWRLIISNLNEKDSFLYSKLPTLTKSYGLNSLRNVDIDNDLLHLLINECVLFPDCYIAVWNVFNVLYKPFMWACLIDPQWESKPQWRSDKQRPPIVFYSRVYNGPNVAIINIFCVLYNNFLFYIYIQISCIYTLADINSYLKC